MSGPFDFVTAILEKTEDPLKKGELDIKAYVPHIVNRACSFRADAVPVVQLVNTRPSMPHEGQYRVLHALIKKRRTQRSEFWIKVSKVPEAIALVMDIYGIGRRKAEELVKVFGAERVMKELKT